VYEEDLDQTENMSALNFVDFYFFPHLNSKWFPKCGESVIRESVKGIKEKIYALDDNSALKIVDGKVEVVSEGKWFAIN
jgi:dipeptidase E